MKNHYLDNVFVAILVVKFLLPSNMIMSYVSFVFSLLLLYIVIRYPLKYRHLYFGILAVLYSIAILFYEEITGLSTLTYGIGDYIMLSVIFFLEFHFIKFEKKFKREDDVITISDSDSNVSK